MVKKVLIIALIFCLFFSSTAFAVETAGEVVFRDALYGAAIGGILAGAIYLIDQDELATKLGTGVAIGTIAGVLYGLYENTAMAEIQNGQIKIAMPTPQVIKAMDGSTVYGTTVVRVKF